MDFYMLGLCNGRVTSSPAADVGQFARGNVRLS